MPRDNRAFKRSQTKPPFKPTELQKTLFLEMMENTFPGYVTDGAPQNDEHIYSWLVAAGDVLHVLVDIGITGICHLVYSRDAMCLAVAEATGSALLRDQQAGQSGCTQTYLRLPCMRALLNPDALHQKDVYGNLNQITMLTQGLD